MAKKTPPEPMPSALEQRASAGFGVIDRVHDKMAECERKAWVSLAGYKFVMFGYWAAQWVLCKSLLPHHVRNPFASLVRFAKEECRQKGWLDKEGSDNE